VSLIRDLAFRIAGNDTNVLSILSDYVLWVTQNVEYGSIDVPRFPNETVLGRTGDCDDQANLLIGLCRAAGIPAYLQIGCIYMPVGSSTSNYWEGLWTSTLTDIGWHGWAVVYVPPWGWLPVDLTYSRGNSSDSLSHITSSAVITDPTVQYANVTVTDYVSDSRRFKSVVVSGMRRIITSDVLVEEVHDDEASESTVWVLSQFNVYFAAFVYATCVVTPFFVFSRRVWVRKRANA
jgi:transglutaminase-like putative cysteine protease